MLPSGAVTTAHNAITATATSSEIDCIGFNSVIVETIGTSSADWAIVVQGTLTSGGTVGDCYSSTNFLASEATMSFTVNADATELRVFRGIPRFVKIKATRTAGTLTVNVQPINL